MLAVTSSVALLHSDGHRALCAGSHSVHTCVDTIKNAAAEVKPTMTGVDTRLTTNPRRENPRNSCNVSVTTNDGGRNERTYLQQANQEGQGERNLAIVLRAYICSYCVLDSFFRHDRHDGGWSCDKVGRGAQQRIWQRVIAVRYS